MNLKLSSKDIFITFLSTGTTSIFFAIPLEICSNQTLMYYKFKRFTNELLQIFSIIMRIWSWPYWGLNSELLLWCNKLRNSWERFLGQVLELVWKRVVLTSKKTLFHKKEHNFLQSSRSLLRSSIKVLLKSDLVIYT